MPSRDSTQVGFMPVAESPKVLSGQTEVFYALDAAPSEPVLVFHHLQKTAGTALRKLIRDNLPPAERHVGRVRGLRQRSSSELATWYREYYEGLPAQRRQALCCVMAHTANYLLPLIERPVQAITLVRDPVDRVVSQYYFARNNRGKRFGLTGSPPPESYRAVHPSTLDDIYAGLAGGSPRDSDVAFRNSRFFNGQSRSLLDPHYDTTELSYTRGAPADADLWRERLFSLVSQHYTVGVQERFDDFVSALGQHFGWRTFIPHSKVNDSRPALAEVPLATQETIRAFNWLDDELHRHHASRRCRRSVVVGVDP